jgi:hypothetical protein
MKKLRLLFCLLVVVCIIASSSTFSAMPQGKFPIQIMSSRDNPTPTERQVVKQLERAFNNSPNFRVTNIDENRIMLGILMQEYIPGVVSTDVLASASPVKIYTLVWLAKPKGNHAYFVWHQLARYSSYNEITEHVLKSADTIVWRIKNIHNYVFD